ncbi:MAG: hypothetical protein GY805_13710 [Chloroflexi bacterium]|nr:hypothetical protein [Chloroflexota bacterium]
MAKKKFLFGAEVNKIQETVFAASLQRQVVGGSQLLSVFSEQVAQTAVTTKVAPNKTIVKAGGTFRMIFDDSEKAQKFGELAATAYHKLLNGVMTVAKPVEFEDRGEKNCPDDDKQCAKMKVTLCYTCANEALDLAIKQLKRQRPFLTSQPQAPAIAFCKHSGIHLAERWEKELPEQDKEAYFSNAVLKMRDIGHREKKMGTAVSPHIVQEGFLKEISKMLPKRYQKWLWAKDPESLAAYDPERRNIAYLIADGNNMGTYFGKCRSAQQSQELSDALTKTVYNAIAKPIEDLVNCLIDNPQDKSLPLLPLVAAGDDIFLMLPARYALDYARHFCKAFEKINNERIIIDLRKENSDLPPVTMSAALVLCKQTYPYLLAHRLGESLLKQTKQMVKWVGRNGQDSWYSAVSFSLILGSVGGNGRLHPDTHRPTLGSYWVADEPDKQALDSAIPLKYILDTRLSLKKLPAKRRAELRTLFDKPPQNRRESRQRWDREFGRIMRRIEATESAQTTSDLKIALTQCSKATVDEKNPAGWWSVSRYDARYAAHGLPDLLAVWAYSQKLDKHLGSY